MSEKKLLANADKDYRCRKLLESDLEKVMIWRMTPFVTKYMKSDPKLTLDDQIIWYSNLCRSEQLYYWIIEVNGTPCGLINLSDVNCSNKRCTWGYYVAEEKFRSFHLAISLEGSLYNYVFDIMGFNKISGEVFTNNIAAIKLHELCGCEKEGILKQHILKNGKYYDVIIQSMFAHKWKDIRTNFNYQQIEFAD